MSAPLVVNTKDGTCWTRREATRGGESLYAPEKCGQCPEFVMATLTELAEHGIVGSADALPMPTGPEPLALSEQQIEALAAAGDRVVNDAVHQDLCACDAWPERCLSTGNYFMGAWDVSGLETALPAVLGLWEQMRGGELKSLRARVAELEVERHSTNEALDDAVQALREGETAEVPALTVFRASHESIVMGLYTTAAEARKHCETFVRREEAGGDRLSFDWIPDDEDDPAIWELVVQRGEDETTTGYCVAVVDVASAFDEEADE